MTDEAPTYQRERIRDWNITKDKKCCGTCACSRSISIDPFIMGCVEASVSADGVPVPIITARSTAGVCRNATLWRGKK